MGSGVYSCQGTAPERCDSVAQVDTFIFNLARGVPPLQAFDDAYPIQSTMPLAKKLKALEILMKKEKTQELLKQYEIYPKKEAYSMSDIESSLVSMCEASIMDFMTVTPDGLGGQQARFRVMANADIRNIKALEIKRDGTIKVVLYDRLDALKALAIVQQTRQQQNVDNYGEIAASLNKIMQGDPRRLTAGDNDIQIIG